MATRRALVAVGTLVLAAAAGCLSPSSSSAHTPAPSARADAAGVQPQNPRTISPTLPSLRPLEGGFVSLPAPPVQQASSAPAPVRLKIPALGVDAPLVRLDLNPDRTIEVPADFDTPGWYGRGPAPGADGAAVILGHLDSYTGPAVFWRLSSLHPGDQIRVEREDGSEVRFSVERSESYSVDSFPSFDIYGATSRPELRLITCAGDYSRARRQYLSNTVVFASLAA